MPKYLAVLDERHGRAAGATPPPKDRSYFVASFEERWAEQTPPAVIVVSPGTLGELELHGPRATVAQWQQVNVTITVGAASTEGVREKAHILAAAARLVLLHQVPGDIVDRVRPLGQRYDLRLRTGQQRSRQRLACGVRAALRVPDVAASRGPFPDDPAELDYLVPDRSRTAIHAVPPTHPIQEP